MPMSRSFDRGDVYGLTKEFLTESGKVNEDTTGSALGENSARRESRLIASNLLWAR